MNDPSVLIPADVGEPILRDVTALVVGDVIAAPWLPLRRPGRVIFVKPFRPNEGERWVFVAYETDSGTLDGTSWLAGEGVRLDHAADPTGQLYSRADEPDEATPVSGGRLVPHVGVMTDGGLVDETVPIAEHYDTTDPDAAEETCACGAVFRRRELLQRHIAAWNSPERIDATPASAE